MGPSLNLAVELPPVPALGPVSLEPWWQLALASVRAGAGVVWFTGGPEGRSSADGGAPEADDGVASSSAVTPMWCDACTIAAAVPRIDGALHGVVSSLPKDRHPSLLARDVTTLDIVSAGRAALLLRWGVSSASPLRHADLSAACGYLTEAVVVCRAVFLDGDPVFEGRYLHIAGAVNRPPPIHPGGPPLLVQAPPGAAALARDDDWGSYFLRQAVMSATAVVCNDDLEEVAAWRALIDEAAAAPWAGTDPGDGPKILFRTTLPDIAAERESEATAVPSRASGLSRLAHLEEARAAGADGVVVRIAGSWQGKEGKESKESKESKAHLDSGGIARTAEEVAGCFRPWQG